MRIFQEPLTAALVAHLLLKRIIQKCDMTSLKQAYLVEQAQ